MLLIRPFNYKDAKMLKMVDREFYFNFKNVNLGHKKT